MPASTTTVGTSGRFGVVGHRLTAVATAGRYVVAAAPFVYAGISIYSITIDRPDMSISISRPSFTIVIHRLLE